MKKFLCFIFLVGVVSGIVIITVYTLNHRELRSEKEEKIVNKIEQVTSNLSGNNLSEIYNVYLNKEKHKLKLSYTVTLKANQLADIDLVIYLDGVLVFEDRVSKEIEGVEVETVLARDDVNKYVKLDLNDISILKADKLEYMVLTIGYIDTYVKEKYYIFNSAGKILDKSGIILRDTSKYYVNSEGAELDIFYDNVDGQKLAKIVNNNIYAIIDKKVKDDLKLIEYKYFINEKKLDKEKIQEFEDISLKERENTTLEEE